MDTSEAPGASDTHSLWEEFADVVRAEAAARNLRFLALGAVLVAVFTIFDLLFEPLSGRELLLRVGNNLIVIAVLGLVGMVLRLPWGRNRVFPILFALCVLVLVGQAYLLGRIAEAAGRLGFHYLAVLGLTMAGVQWFWQWQLGLGVVAVILFASALPTSHPDYGFYVLSLAGSGVLATAFGRSLLLIRYEQFATAARLRRAGEQLRHHSARLEAKNAEMRDFFYVLSHDLRAPLINLEGFSEELGGAVARLDGILGPAVDTAGADGAAPAWRELRENMDESLHFIRSGAAKMSSLVRGILELSHLDTRAREARAVALDAVVREVLDSFHHQIAARSIAVSVDRLPVVVGEPVFLAKLFANLIDNSIKYMKPDGEARIDVRCRRLAGCYELSVHDTGIGIRREDQGKIFRLFSRVGANQSEGEGVGLAAVKKIVERHGGTISVESEPGEGTTISFTLPTPS